MKIFYIIFAILLTSFFCCTAKAAKIAFQSDRDGISNIYLMNTDGSNQIRLTNSEGENWGPVFSPDGQKIAFVSNRSGSPRIYIMKWDGSQAQEIPNSDDAVPGPYIWWQYIAWSPDGQKLLFITIDNSIAAINLDGSNKTILVAGGFDGHSVISGIEWGPTMNDIYSSAYYFWNGYDQHIFHYFISDNTWTQITQQNVYQAPQISNNGIVIVYQQDNNTGGKNIFSMDTQGNNVHQLTFDQGSVISIAPDWAGDTGEIIYSSNRTGTFQIWMMDSTGGNVRMLSGEGNNYLPSYSSVSEPTTDVNMVWVSINDPGVSGHEGFTGYMSKYETTNAQYCQFLNAALASGDITVDGDNVLGASGSNSGADFVGQFYYNLAGTGASDFGATNGGAARINYSGGVFSVDSGFENHPVTWVSWYGATAFCNYYGYRLPTEWEWQAVADYDGSYIYGCGTNIGTSKANYWDSIHPDGTTIVGAFGAYGYGIADMAGNVFEWTSSLWACGGSWHGNINWCAVSSRSFIDNTYPNYWNINVGFRVVRTVSPPVANAGDNIQIASAEQIHTVIQGTATDPDGDILEYRWLEGEQVLLDWSAADSNGEAYLDLATLPYFSIGNHTLILEAREVKSCGLSASDEMVLTIENSPPVVQAAPKQQVVEVGIDPIVVVGDAGDFDGDTLVYKWLDDSNNVLASGTVAATPGGAPVTIPDLDVPAGDDRFPVGEHAVRLQVSDGINEPVIDSVSVEVTDTTAPSLSPVPSVTILWPPNHKLIPVTIWANAFDNGGGDIVLSVTVQSSEPADAIGDGNTDLDYYIDSVNNKTGVIELRLRSERAGKGDGRTYTITITATDANQNQSNAVVQIRAPHDKSKK